MKKVKDIYFPRKKNKNINQIALFILYFFISTLIFIILHTFFIRTYEIKNLTNGSKKNIYFLVNIFSKNFQEGEMILAKNPYNKDFILFGIILAKGPKEIILKHDEIAFENKKIIFKKPLPQDMILPPKMELKEKEFYIFSNESLDSLYLGKIQENQIIGKILYRW